LRRAVAPSAGFGHHNRKILIGRHASAELQNSKVNHRDCFSTVP
jgi:hypothetical protein